MITITARHIPKLRTLSEISRDIFDIRNRLKDKNIEMATIAMLTNALKEKTDEYEANKKEIFRDELYTK